MIICDYGCGQEGKFYFKSSKKWCCSLATSSCPEMKFKNGAKKILCPPVSWEFIQQEYDNGFSIRDLSKKYNLSLNRAVRLGLIKTRTVSEAVKLASLQNKCGFLSWSTEKKEEHRNRGKINALRRHAEGWDNKSGRCKKIKYFSEIAGHITVDGTWEHKVAIYFDIIKVNWKRNKERFEYINLKGVKSFYTPDFFVEDYGSYVEVKGYETKLDRCKWSQFNYNLIVLKKEEIIKITKYIKQEKIDV